MTSRSDQCSLVGVHHSHGCLGIGLDGPRESLPQLVFAKDGFPLDEPYWADTVNVAPGERYSVLVHADRVGTWVWHCHILNHVESEQGMFGMATAVIVEES